MHSSGKINETFFTVEIIHGNILHVEFTQNKEIALEDMQLLLKATKNLIGDIPYHSVVDVSTTKNNITKEARDFINEHEKNNNQKLSQSMIVNSIGKSMMIGIFLKFFKPRTEFKTFTSLESAINWIQHEKVDTAKT